MTLGFLVGACAVKPPAQVSGPPSRRIGSDVLKADLMSLWKSPYSDTEAIQVVYATNRALIGPKGDCSDGTFGVTVGNHLSLGVCKMNVPKRHATGAIDLAPDERADTHVYFRFLSHMSLTEKSLKTFLDARGPADLLLFVHGFNVRFEEAALRAAQIAYDLKFQGPVILFSWPAGAETGLWGGPLLTKTYETNQANAEQTVSVFGNFLKTLSGYGRKTHILVHSMGHQVVLPALAQLAGEDPRRWVGELILNAPDIDLERFHDLVPALGKVADRITVYCSYNDKAIAASQALNHGRRMGGCEQVPGVDVINVGEIDAPILGITGLGHGYYASRPILTDLFQALLGMPAENRLFIRKSEPNQVENYYLRP
jgi:esterase/lipase superfamily enzyme